MKIDKDNMRIVLILTPRIFLIYELANAEHKKYSRTSRTNDHGKNILKRTFGNLPMKNPI